MESSGNCRYCGKQATEFLSRADGVKFGLCADHLATYNAETDSIPAPPVESEQEAE